MVGIATLAMVESSTCMKVAMASATVIVQAGRLQAVSVARWPPARLAGVRMDHVGDQLVNRCQIQRQRVALVQRFVAHHVGQHAAVGLAVSTVTSVERPMRSG